MKEKTSIWKSDATKYMAVLWLGYILKSSADSLPSIFLMLVEIIGLASFLIVIVNFIVAKFRKPSKAV